MFTSDTNVFDGDLAYWSVGGTVVADMDASDTATITLHQTGGADKQMYMVLVHHNQDFMVIF